MEEDFSEETIRMAEKLQSQMHEFVEVMTLGLGDHSKVKEHELSYLFILLKTIDLQNEVIKLNKYIIPFERFENL